MTEKINAPKQNKAMKTTEKGKSKPMTVFGTTLLCLAGILIARPASAQTNTVVEEKKPQWEGSAGLGFLLTKGNSDTLLVNIRADGDKKWEKNEVRLGASASYGENEGNKNNQQARGSGQYNRSFGDKDRWYVFGRLEGLYDAIADLDGRINVGPGLGYYLIKQEKKSLSAEAGPGAVFEKYAGEDWQTYLTLRLAERFDYKFNDRAKLWQSVEYMPDVTEFGRYIVNAEIGIETTITKEWAMRVALQNSYNSQPSSGRDRNDLKLIAGVTYKF
jgi:putative salt-induced outer membrane protein